VIVDPCLLALTSTPSICPSWAEDTCPDKVTSARAGVEQKPTANAIATPARASNLGLRIVHPRGRDSHD
jgi:hypothetical protein